MIVWSCDSLSDSDNVVELGESKTGGDIIVCNCEDLTKDSIGILNYNGIPFTGNCLIKYQNSEKTYIEKQILNGQINGKIKYFNRSGKVLFEENFVQGEFKLDLSQESIHCNYKSLTFKQEGFFKKCYYNDMLFTGTCSDQYPNSDQDYFKSTYKDGLLHGYNTYYDKNGEILYQEKYRSDTLVKVVHSN